jgi:hypothetical protein
VKSYFPHNFSIVASSPNKLNYLPEGDDKEFFLDLWILDEIMLVAEEIRGVARDSEEMERIRKVYGYYSKDCRSALSEDILDLEINFDVYEAKVQSQIEAAISEIVSGFGSGFLTHDLIRSTASRIAAIRPKVTRDLVKISILILSRHILR